MSFVILPNLDIIHSYQGLSHQRHKEKY